MVRPRRTNGNSLVHRNASLNTKSMRTIRSAAGAAGRDLPARPPWVGSPLFQEVEPVLAAGNSVEILLYRGANGVPRIDTGFHKETMEVAG